MLKGPMRFAFASSGLYRDSHLVRYEWKTLKLPIEGLESKPKGFCDSASRVNCLFSERICYRPMTRLGPARAKPHNHRSFNADLRKAKHQMKKTL
jgi:hypothetical protein